MMHIEDQLAQIAAVPAFERLKSVHRNSTALESETLAEILQAADNFSRAVLEPFEAHADGTGCLLEGGRVLLAPGHVEAWRRFREDGWVGLDLPKEYGGQDLPLVVAIAVQELFDRASVGFGMLPGAARGAGRLLLAHADEGIVSEWLPQLTCGNWAATICISEAGAGSDVGRIRTQAVRTGAGHWLVTGEKIWISYGEHPLAERIGHLVLARTTGAPAGVLGLSLFLVPSMQIGTDRTAIHNGVTARRIETKLGLHVSPTCAMGFENAFAVLIGTEGRGVAQLFRMIVAMRLQVGAQSLGLAAACFNCASSYAHTRLQGGTSDRPPVPIDRHGDIRRMLIGSAARLETLRGVVYCAATTAELADTDAGEAGRQAAVLLSGWLLPIVKNSGAETASEAARSAMLVLGGAGYTREWPVERYLRDAQVLAIYEGTTGMQALDLLRRRWLRPGTGAEVFRSAMANEMSADWPEEIGMLSNALSAFDEATAWIRDPARTTEELAAGAYSALTLASELAHGWMAARLVRCAQSSPSGRRLAACGRHGLSVMTERVPAALRSLKESDRRVGEFEEYRRG
jgi:3-(methylthio)propanoyl-CoA dehydrogenase